MSGKMIKAKVFRFDPSVEKTPRYQIYELPLQKGMSAMEVLDYIYQNLDSSIGYYDHAACALGVCGKCTGKINGRPGLLCRTEVAGDVALDPLNESKVVRDLICRGN
jgi:fumarate reductase iron-sulfur subunit